MVGELLGLGVGLGVVDPGLFAPVAAEPEVPEVDPGFVCGFSGTDVAPGFAGLVAGLAGLAPGSEFEPVGLAVPAGVCVVNGGGAGTAGATPVLWSGCWFVLAAGSVEVAGCEACPVRVAGEFIEAPLLLFCVLVLPKPREPGCCACAIRCGSGGAPSLGAPFG